MVFPILPANTLADASYDIDNSLRFDGVDARFVGQTSSGDPFNSASNRRTFTISMWIKFSKVSTAAQHLFNAGTGTTWAGFYLNNNKLYSYGETSGSASWNLSTNRLFRDPFAWYHLVLAVDTTQGTAANRVKLYINGEQYTWDDGTTYPSQN